MATVTAERDSHLQVYERRPKIAVYVRSTETRNGGLEPCRGIVGGNAGVTMS
jgi:hypothetical protein